MNTKNNIFKNLCSVKNSELVINTIPQAEAMGEYVFNLYKPSDNLELYFADLATCMAKLGCHKMELKCRIKSLLLEYQNIAEEYRIPMNQFKALYYELLASGYDKVATWLMARHQQVVAYISYSEQRVIYNNTALDKWFKTTQLLTSNGVEFAEILDCDDSDRKSFELIPFQNEHGKWGYQDGFGKCVIDAIYDYAQEFLVYNSFFAAVNVAGKWGVINAEGCFVIEPKYDSIAACDKTHFDIEQRGAKGKVDLFGNEYWAVVSTPLEANCADMEYHVESCLLGYLSDYILPKYRNYRCDVTYLADRALRNTVEISEVSTVVPFVKSYYASHNILYTAVVFHNLAVTEGEDGNYIRSANMLRDDYYIKAFFSESEIDLMAEAIEDILLPREEEARSFYGRILRVVVAPAR